jgi:hypothetical protein
MRWFRWIVEEVEAALPFIVFLALWAMSCVLVFKLFG